MPPSSRDFEAAEEEGTRLRNGACEAWEEMYQRVLQDIEKGDNEYNKGVIKLNQTHSKSSLAKNASNFHSFHHRVSGGSRCGGFRVQPTAVSRRVVPNGSRQKIDTASKSKGLPHRPISTKRMHNASHCIAKNQPFAKKAGRVMLSNTTYPGPSTTTMKQPLLDNTVSSIKYTSTRAFALAGG